MEPMAAVTASYEQLAFAAIHAEIEPMEAVVDRCDSIEASTEGD